MQNKYFLPFHAFVFSAFSDAFCSRMCSVPGSQMYNHRTQSRVYIQNLGVESMEWPASHPHPRRTCGLSCCMRFVPEWPTQPYWLTLDNCWNLLKHNNRLSSDPASRPTGSVPAKQQSSKHKFPHFFCTRFTQWMRVEMKLTKDPQASLHLRKRRSQLCNSFDGATKPQRDLIGPIMCQTRFPNYDSSKHSIHF